MSTHTAPVTASDHSPALVIVESPAKAKTIAKILGSGYLVEASVGHIADLPTNSLGVDVEAAFTPQYQLTTRGREVITQLKAQLSTCSALYLATDEDREGEAIAWHLLTHLEPEVPVYRLVFHEITRDAVLAALAAPRQIDMDLVNAAETRRILDRLYGYEVSPVLWKKVNGRLSAGRVQSPAVRLLVERERERMAFVPAPWWDLRIETATQPGFTARLSSVDQVPIARGQDFDSHGHLTSAAVALSEDRAFALRDAMAGVELRIGSVDHKAYRSKPQPPFSTASLQVEAGRRLRISAQQVMSLAQGLYEAGYITYMRTDNTVLSAEALSAVRETAAEIYGAELVTPAPRIYPNKIKNTQEAHEAIRPAVPLRTPEQVGQEISDPQELALYRLIWQRTLASQMIDATGSTMSVRLQAICEVSGRATEVEFSAAGTRITEPGYRRVMADLEKESEHETGQDEVLPALEVGEQITVTEVIAQGHTTTPPARYTEASIVKRLEELGIGRPSTWASTIAVVRSRKYVVKRGAALVPTWAAFAVTRVLEAHFADLVDYDFTAVTETDLDAIARGEMDKVDWLTGFYFGDASTVDGLRAQVEANLSAIDAAASNKFILGVDPDLDEEVFVKSGRYGPFVRRGSQTVGIPDTLAPDELTLEAAITLLNTPKVDREVGVLDGVAVVAKSGRYGPYLQHGSETRSLESVDQLMTVTLAEAVVILSQPKTTRSPRGFRKKGSVSKGA
jgi:DNA topoisomerase-1